MRSRNDDGMSNDANAVPRIKDAENENEMAQQQWQ